MSKPTRSAAKGISVELFTPSRVQQLTMALSNTQVHLGQAQSVLRIVIDSLPPMEEGRIANALEAVGKLLSFAQVNASDAETYALTKEVPHA